MLLDLIRTDRGQWTVLSPVGDLDLGSAPQLHQAVVAVVAEGRRHIVLDLAGVGFVDSAGLGAFVAATKRARSNGGDLRVAGADERVWAPFVLTGLDSVFRRFASAEEALGSEAVGESRG